MDEIKKAILQVPLLNNLPEREQNLISQICSLENAPNGKFLARANTPIKEILFIISGAAKLSQANPVGKEVIIALLGPGEHIGIVSLLTAVPRPNDVIATCRSTYLRMPANDFLKLLPALHSLSYALLLSMTKRLEQTSRHLAEISLYNLDLRLSLRLLELSEVIEIDDRERLIVRQRPSHQDLADLLGVSREAITRSLKKLENDGRIEVCEDQIFVISTPP